MPSGKRIPHSAKALTLDFVPRRRLEMARNNPGDPAGKILQAAAEVFAEQGYGGATTREIAARAGVNIATVHYYWGSKEELWLSVLHQVMTKLTELASGITQGFSEDPKSGIREIIGRLVDIFADNPNYAILLQHGSVSGYREETLQALLLPLLNLGMDFVKNRVVRGGEPPFDPRMGLFCLAGALRIFFQEKDAIKVVFGEDPAAYSPAFREKLKEILILLVFRMTGLDET